jgi:hypothetical protein
MPGVHTIPVEDQRSFLEEIAPKVDVLVYQPILNRYRGEESPIFGSDHVKSHIPAQAIKVSFPSLHFFGYQPRAAKCTVVTPEAGAFCKREFGQSGRQLIHHHQVVRSYLIDRDVSEAVRAFDEGEPGDEAQAIDKTEQSLNHMRYAETHFDIDIRMSGFISDRFADRMLFHTVAHPGGEVLVRVARRILNILSVDVTREEMQRMRWLEPLAFVVYPLQSYVRKALNLRFSGPAEFSSYDGVMTKTEMVEKYYGLYDLFNRDIWEAMSDRFPDLVDLNHLPLRQESSPSS